MNTRQELLLFPSANIKALEEVHLLWAEPVTWPSCGCRTQHACGRCLGTLYNPAVEQHTQAGGRVLLHHRHVESCAIFTCWSLLPLRLTLHVRGHHDWEHACYWHMNNLMLLFKKAILKYCNFFIIDLLYFLTKESCT